MSSYQDVYNQQVGQLNIPNYLPDRPFAGVNQNGIYGVSRQILYEWLKSANPNILRTVFTVAGQLASFMSQRRVPPEQLIPALQALLSGTSGYAPRSPRKLKSPNGCPTHLDSRSCVADSRCYTTRTGCRTFKYGQRVTSPRGERSKCGLLDLNSCGTTPGCAWGATGCRSNTRRVKGSNSPRVLYSPSTGQQYAVQGQLGQFRR